MGEKSTMGQAAEKKLCAVCMAPFWSSGRRELCYDHLGVEVEEKEEGQERRVNRKDLHLEHEVEVTVHFSSSATVALWCDEPRLAAQDRIRAARKAYDACKGDMDEDHVEQRATGRTRYVDDDGKVVNDKQARRAKPEARHEKVLEGFVA